MKEVERNNRFGHSSAETSLTQSSSSKAGGFLIRLGATLRRCTLTVKYLLIAYITKQSRKENCEGGAAHQVVQSAVRQLMRMGHRSLQIEGPHLPN